MTQKTEKRQSRDADVVGARELGVTARRTSGAPVSRRAVPGVALGGPLAVAVLVGGQPAERRLHGVLRGETAAVSGDPVLASALRAVADHPGPATPGRPPRQNPHRLHLRRRRNELVLVGLHDGLRLHRDGTGRNDLLHRLGGFVGLGAALVLLLERHRDLLDELHPDRGGGVILEKLVTADEENQQQKSRVQGDTGRQRDNLGDDEEGRLRDVVVFTHRNGSETVCAWTSYHYILPIYRQNASCRTEVKGKRHAVRAKDIYPERRERACLPLQRCTPLHAF